jgi:hypothetical protein
MKVVCGLDVHKDSVFCCILCANGEKIQHKFGVLTEELVTLRDLMVSEGVEECAMESTSIYWIPIWRVLEGSVKLHLVNPYFIKQLPGKKSDVNDAEWIATCLSKELIASSFVTDDKIQRLRQYDRRIFDLNASISRNLVKLDQCIQRCNIRISNYISTTDSMKASLSILSEFKTRGRKIAVLSDMLELGPDSPEYHKEVGRFIATTKVTDLFITGELSRHYIEEAWKENPSLHTRAFSSNGELIAFLETYLKKNDVVLIKGSNGMNLKEVSKALMA